MSKEIIKIRVIYNTGSSTFESNFVASYSVYEQLLEDIKDVSLDWVTFKGKINDIDGNAVGFAVKREDISSIDYIRANGIE